MVPGTTFCKGGGTWYQKTGAPVPFLYESVPITIASMELFGIPGANFNFFNTVDNDIDAAAMRHELFGLVHWSHEKLT